MSEENKAKGIMDITLDKLRALVDADVIIGTPVTAGKITLIPVSRASFGVATGGSDIPAKGGVRFGGGGGAGVTITPMAFVCVCGESVRMLPVYSNMNSFDKAVSMAPDLLEKVKGLFKKSDPDTFIDK